MIQLVRILGWLLMAVGAVVIATWLIKPLRQVWPAITEWFQMLPLPIQVGLVIAALGFLLLISSLIWERIEDRKHEGNLLDDDEV